MSGADDIRRAISGVKDGRLRDLTWDDVLAPTGYTVTEDGDIVNSDGTARDPSIQHVSDEHLKIADERKTAALRIREAKE